MVLIQYEHRLGLRLICCKRSQQQGQAETAGGHCLVHSNYRTRWLHWETKLSLNTRICGSCKTWTCRNCYSGFWGLRTNPTLHLLPPRLLRLHLLPDLTPIRQVLRLMMPLTNRLRIFPRQSALFLLLLEQRPRPLLLLIRRLRLRQKRMVAWICLER